MKVANWAERDLTVDIRIEHEGNLLVEKTADIGADEDVTKYDQIDDVFGFPQPGGESGPEVIADGGRLIITSASREITPHFVFRFRNFGSLAPDHFSYSRVLLGEESHV